MRQERCGSDSVDGSGKKSEILCAVVLYGVCCAREDSVEEDCDRELNFCAGR